MILTGGSAASWSVQPGLDEILGRLLLVRRRCLLLHRLYRVFSLKAGRRERVQLTLKTKPDPMIQVPEPGRALSLYIHMVII